jgi:hypothetical protein
VFTSHLDKWNTVLTAESDDLPEEFEVDFEDDASNTTDTSDGTHYDKEKTTETELNSPLLHNANLSTRTVDPITFTAGRIKTIWLEVGTLWRTHLETVHQNTITSQSPVVLADLKSKIRLLHSLQTKVLPQHRASYFHPDLEAYLASATLHSLRTYIATYRPVIMASIKAAETEQTASILTTIRGVVPTTTSHHHVTGHQALEEAPHRKRNRLRTLSWVVLWIIRVAKG